MVTGTLQSRQLLPSLMGTAPFLEYCEWRGIVLEKEAMATANVGRWQEAVRDLPEAVQARVELELAQVAELSHPPAVELLCAAAAGREIAPDLVPGEAPLALWFFLHQAALFQEVLFQYELKDVAAWRTAHAPAGLALGEDASRQSALAESLREFFRRCDGSGRYCTVERHRVGEAVCFTAYVSDRLQFLEMFTEDGTHTRQPARPAFPLVFAYYPADGRILLRARQRSRERVLELFQRFGRAALDVELDERCLAPGFHLDVLKRRCDLPPDGPDMEAAHVRALHLAYPGRAGRRQVKLETLSGDGPFAIVEMLREHGGCDGRLDELHVIYAELLVQLRTYGRSRRHLIRLWPDRCNLDRTPTGERLDACLRRWGIAYAA
jgi:hypothetical protein